jgi:hypothetical protein
MTTLNPLLVVNPAELSPNPAPASARAELHDAIRADDYFRAAEAIMAPRPADVAPVLKAAVMSAAYGPAAIGHRHPCGARSCGTDVPAEQFMCETNTALLQPLHHAVLDSYTPG